MTALLLFLSLCWADWTVINITDGITVSQKTIPNSDLFAFRGEGVVDVHISKLQSVLFDEKRGNEWVDLMEEAYPVTDWIEDKRIIYQKYDLPWPIQDRDYVMTQKRDFNVDTKTITATYQSVEIPKKNTARMLCSSLCTTHVLENGSITKWTNQSSCRSANRSKGSIALVVDQHDSKRLALQLHHKSNQTGST